MKNASQCNDRKACLFDISMLPGKGKETFAPRARTAGNSHVKGTGMPVGNLKRTSKKYQDPVLWAWLEMFLSPKKYHAILK